MGTYHYSLRKTGSILITEPETGNVVEAYPFKYDYKLSYSFNSPAYERLTTRCAARLDKFDKSDFDPKYVFILASDDNKPSVDGTETIYRKNQYALAWTDGNPFPGTPVGVIVKTTKIDRKTVYVVGKSVQHSGYTNDPDVIDNLMKEYNNGPSNQ